MRKIDVPILPELKRITDLLQKYGCDLYLSGTLDSGSLYFVDIDWKSAQYFLEAGLPEKWTQIYAYFLSVQACKNGEPDPLWLESIDLEMLLNEYQPDHMPIKTYEDHKQALIEQAEYLMQFPPSRLVYLGKMPLEENSLDCFEDLLKRRSDQ